MFAIIIDQEALFSLLSSLIIHRHCHELLEIGTNQSSVWNNNQGYQIWALSGSDWPKIWQIRDIFRSNSRNFSIEICSEKVPDLSHFGSIWPTLGLNLTSLVCILLSILASLDDIAYHRHTHASLLLSLLISRHIV